MVLFCKTIDHFILWFFIFWIIDQINFMILFFNSIDHFILWFLFFGQLVSVLYSMSGLGFFAYLFKKNVKVFNVAILLLWIGSAARLG